eukprot:3913595-Pyramimonas_sp.AAC.1
MESKNGEIENHLVNLDKAVEVFGKSVESFSDLQSEVQQLEAQHSAAAKVVVAEATGRFNGSSEPATSFNLVDA